jgi:type I restriction enzyme S subunit
MDLFFAHPGDIVVSKIDLKNGAVGIVPLGLQNVVVTNHFVVYEPLDALHPPYLIRIIQSPFFKDYLWRKKVGSEGRKEVKIDHFERTLIPLPSREVQEALVVSYSRIEQQLHAVQSQLHAEKTRLADSLITCEASEGEP